jgi:hypothetical protein
MGDVGAEYYSYLWEIRANPAAIDKGEWIGFESSLIASFHLVAVIYRKPMSRNTGAVRQKSYGLRESPRSFCDPLKHRFYELIDNNFQVD